MSLMLHRAGLLRPSAGDAEPSVPDAFEAGDWSLAHGNAHASVTISELPANGGALITDIEYRLDGGSWISSGGTTSFAITGLTNDQEYDVVLRAVNSVGAGAAGDEKQVTPLADVTVPDAFAEADWSVSSGNTEADVTVHSLPANGGASITNIEYRLDGGSWVSSGGTTTFTIIGLSNDQEYDVELRAVNSVGAGAASDEKQVTPEADEEEGWSPSDISAAVWLQISDLSTLYQERTGPSATTPAGVGDPVGSARNKGSAGGWAVAPTDAARPVLRQDGDKYYLEFAGTDDHLNLVAWSSTSSDLWAASGFNMDSGAPSNTRILSFSLVGGSGDTESDFVTAHGWAVGREGSSNYVRVIHRVFSVSQTPVEISYGADTIFDVQLTVAGSSLVVSGGTPVTNSFAFNPDFTRVRIGATTGPGGGAGEYFVGRVYCAVCGEGTFDSGERADLRAWVANETGVTL